MFEKVATELKALFHVQSWPSLAWRYQEEDYDGQLTITFRDARRLDPQRPDALTPSGKLELWLSRFELDALVVRYFELTSTRKGFLDRVLWKLMWRIIRYFTRTVVEPEQNLIPRR